MTALEMITWALRDIGEVGQGEQLAPEDSEEGLTYLNDLLASLSNDRLNIPAISTYTGRADFCFTWHIHRYGRNRTKWRGRYQHQSRTNTIVIAVTSTVTVTVVITANDHRGNPYIA